MSTMSKTNRMLMGLSFIEATAKNDADMAETILESVSPLDLVIGLTDASILMSDAAASSEKRKLSAPEVVDRVRYVIMTLIADDKIGDDHDEDNCHGFH
jgi:hypothetical protein